MPGERGDVLASILWNLRRFPSRKAVGLKRSCGLRWLTYETLGRAAGAAAAVLEENRVGRGDRVLIWAANSPEWVACLVGSLLRGCVVVPIDANATAEFVTRVRAETSARFVFHGGEQDPAFLGLPARALEAILPEAAAGLPEACERAAPDDPAMVIYTSGTTSDSRGVVLTHRNLQAQIEPFLRWQPLTRLVPFRMLVIAPLTHVQGLMLGALIPLSIGVSAVFVRSVDPAHLLRAIRDNRVTLFSTVPRVLTVLTRAMEARPWGRRRIPLGERLKHETRGWMRRHILFTALNRAVGYRFWVILVGGAALPVYDEQFWRDTGRFVIQGYGLTETAALVALNGPFSRRVGSIGKPLKHVETRIAEDGELLVRAETVSPGYFGEAPQPAGAQYLATGDLVRWWRGRLYFMGRKKHLIVTAEGFNVSPAKVEAALSRAPGVIDSVALARNREGSEEVHAVLLLRAGADAAAAVQHANTLLEEHEKIWSWSVWPEGDFPRSALLKVRADEVERRLAEAPAAGESAAVPNALVSAEAFEAEPDRGRRVQLLARFLHDADARQAGGIQGSLSELGLGSLDRVELITALERLQGRALDHMVIPAEPTVTDLYTALHASSDPMPASPLPSRQPAWAESPPAICLRWLTRPAAVALWQALGNRCAVTWKTDPRRLEPPFLLAAAPHRHWLDSFLIAAILPERLARRMLIVTNRDFSEFFDSGRPATRRERLVVGLGYYLWLPLTFPFTIVPHQGSTRTGLIETARWVDRRYCPLVFPKGILFGAEELPRHDPGVALLASETGTPIVPVWLSGNFGLNWRLRWRARHFHAAIGDPLSVRPCDTREEIQNRLEAAWTELAGGEREHRAPAPPWSE